MLRHLRNVFPIVPTLILSATITPNILDYIQIFLKLSLPSGIYKLFLDRPNLKYMVYSIQKLGFWDIAFLIPKNGPISEIPKTMVFVNKIEDAIELEKYLWSRLPDFIYNGKQIFVIILFFTFNLDANTRTKIMKNLRHKNAQICICIECAGIGINISDIICIIQFKIPDFVALPKLFQRLDRGGKNKSSTTIAIIFVHPSQILFDNMHTLECSAFKSL